MKSNVRYILGIALAFFSVLIFTQTFANGNNNITNFNEYEAQSLDISNIRPTGYDDDVIYGYEYEKYNSDGVFAQSYPNFEIVRNGLRYRGTLYLVYTRSSGPNRWFGLYRGDLYFAGYAK